MRLNAIRLQNFRQHRKTHIDFDLGLTGIIGPNGAGKSTILEAIAWALYGQQAARGTRDSLSFARAPKGEQVVVELDFLLGGHRYRVERRSNGAQVFLDDSDAPVAEGLTAVSEFLRRRLRMSRAEFFHTFFTGQKELSVMAAMSPTERAQFLSRVLGYDRLRTAQARERDQRKLIIAESAGVRSAMPDATAVARAVEESRARLSEATARRAAADATLGEMEAAHAVLSPRWQAAQVARDRRQQVASDLRLAESHVASQARDAERVERDLAAVEQARAELESLAARLAPLNEVMDEFRRLDDLAREEGRRQTLAESLKALREELGRLHEKAAAIARAPRQEEEVTEALEKARRELEETLGTMEARRTDWVRDRQEAETKRDALRRQYQELKAQRDRIAELGEGGACPTCTRVLGQNFRGVMDQLQEQLDTLIVDGKYFTTRLEQLEETPEDIKAFDAQRKALSQDVGGLERQLARVQAAVQELGVVTREVAAKTQRQEALQRDLDAIPGGFDAERHARLREQTAALAPMNERATRLSAQVERTAALHEERERIATSLAAAQARLDALRALAAETEFSEEDFARLRGEVEESLTTVRAAEVAAMSARAEELAGRVALEQAERARTDMERSLEKYQRLERDKRLHDELDRAFTDLRSDLNAQLRPDLEHAASGFLTQLTDGRFAELELDDQYNVSLLEERLSKTVISGGEEDLANLVLRLAISQMIAERAGLSFSLLVLDEVLGSLDETRRHNVVQLLRRLQDRFEQVILITHIESVRDELDHVIQVGYDEESGASVVRQFDPAMPELADMLASAGASAASLNGGVE